MATDIVSLLTQDEIPVKLRCARCNKLALGAFRLPCCDQSICESCHITLPEECPVCAHSPLTPADCKPNKALRLTVKAFLKNEEKKRERAAAAAAAAEVKVEEPAATPAAEAPEPDLSDANRAADTAELSNHDGDVVAQLARQADAAPRQIGQETVQEDNREEYLSSNPNGNNTTTQDRPSTIERDTPEIEIITGDEQRQSAEAMPDNTPTQPKSFDQQPAMGQFNFNAFGQNMGWNPAMVQQMMSMQNGLSSGNWGGFPMMGMNGMGMDPSMMNMNMNMMGGMNMGGNNWGWNQQQGMGSMGTENMMNMSGNFNATGGYASGAGYNAHMMSQQGNSQSHMTINHGQSMSKDVVGNGAAGSNIRQGGNSADDERNDFLPGDAGDSRPTSSSGNPPRLGLSTEMTNDTMSIQNGESAFSPAPTQANGSMYFDQTNGQQISTYIQDDAGSAMYPNAPGYGNEAGYNNMRGRGGFRGRGFFRGRGGRFNDFDSTIPLTGPDVGKGVEGAPTGPKAMREPQAGLASGFRGGRGGFVGPRGAFMNGATAAKSQNFAPSAKSIEQQPLRDDASRASSRRRSRSRSVRGDTETGHARSLETPEAGTVQHERHGRTAASPDVNEGSRENGTSNRRHREVGTSSRHESRRHTPDVDVESDREPRTSSHRSSRHQRERSREKDKERKHRSSRHHEHEDRSRSRDRDHDRDRDRERRRHRHRSRSPGRDQDDRPADEDDEHRSSRHHRHRDERHRDRDRDSERERERKRDKEAPRGETSSRRDRDRDRDRDRHDRDQRDRDRHRDRPSISNGHSHGADDGPSIPTGPRNSTSTIPTGPRNGTTSVPTGPRSYTHTSPTELRIQGRSGRAQQPIQPSGPSHSRRPSSPRAQDHTSTPQAEQYVDAHALEREARNRERLLKEQQRRGGGFASSISAATSSANVGGKRRASGDEDAGRGKYRRKGRGGVKYEDDDGRARRVEEEREAARWG